MLLRRVIETTDNARFLGFRYSSSFSSFWKTWKKINNCIMYTVTMWLGGRTYCCFVSRRETLFTLPIPRFKMIRFFRNSGTLYWHWRTQRKIRGLRETLFPKNVKLHYSDNFHPSLLLFKILIFPCFSASHLWHWKNMLSERCISGCSLKYSSCHADLERFHLTKSQSD